MILVVADSDLLTANGNLTWSMLMSTGMYITTGINRDLLMVNVGFDGDDDG